MEGEGEGEEGSAIASIAAFSLRALGGIGIPVGRVLRFAERVHPRMRRFVSPYVAILETCSHESVTALFLRACARVVDKFGKVIYIMFFLVVHLMKLHSLSLIWGVTTEAMEYEEGAEERMTAARERLGGVDGGGGSSALAGGGGGTTPGDDDEADKSAGPSKSCLRLKRLGFVGFGGTLGGILGR